jgi:hypothetical protein
MAVQTCQPLSGPRSAKRQVQQPNVIEPLEPLPLVAADERMLEKRKQRNRREILRNCRGKGEEQGPGGRFRQRLAGAVVCLDIPARQERRHAPRERPVRSHQCRSSAGSFQRLADRKRDRLRFGGGIGQHRSANPAQPPLSRLETDPLGRIFGRSHCVGDRAGPLRRRGGNPDPRPQPDLLARNPDSVEQKLEVELRVCLLASSLLVGAERIPFLLRHRRSEREPRKHNCASRHARRAPKKRRDRRRGRGDPGGNCESRRGLVPPALRQPVQKHVAPLREIDPA